MEITLGDFDRNLDEGTEAVYHAAEVIPHPGFNRTRMFENDIGLIRSSKEMRFDRYIRPICYPSRGDAFDKRDHCVVSGWGSYIQVIVTVNCEL